MAPKTASAPKKAGTVPSHASYKDMIKVAIVNLKDRMGSSRQAIKKYVRSNNNLGATTDAAFDKHISQALAAGEKAGEFNRPKGPSGPVKLAKKEAVKKESTPKASATATKTKAAAKPKTTAKAPAKKATTTTTKKTTATKKAPAKAATTKANTSKKAAPRKKATASATTAKKPAAAPAVVDKKPTVLGKTKSGRVTKTTAATSKKAAPKKAAPKKTAPKKATAAAKK